MYGVDRSSVLLSTRPRSGAKKLLVAEPIIVRPADVLRWSSARSWHLDEAEKVDLEKLCQLKSCPPALVVEGAIANVMEALAVDRAMATIRHVGVIRVVRPIIIGEPVRPIAIVRYANRYGSDWVHLTLGIDLLDGKGALLATVEVGVEVAVPRIMTADRQARMSGGAPRSSEFGLV